MLGGDSARAPRARSENLVVREAAGEVLVYDLDRHVAVCLNRTAALVWESCDGRRSAAEIARRVSRELGHVVPEEVVWLALEQLGRDHLLEAKARRPAALAGISRRELIKKAGIAAAFALPVVSSIVAPTPAQAGSCRPAGSLCSPDEIGFCCNGVCPETGVCP